jgi:hypothetical protein
MGDAVAQFVIDTRKFEIELYWKRAAYFWAFIASAFAGYLALLARGSPSPALALVLVECLGLLFSVAWYCVNRGSKYWQTNWEAHLDRLETAELGKVYRTVLDPDQFDFWRLTAPYAYSVSKINQILSIVLTTLWLGLLVLQLFTSWPFEPGQRSAIYLLLSLTLIGTIALLRVGRTARKSKTLNFITRNPTYTDSDSTA